MASSMFYSVKLHVSRNTTRKGPIIQYNQYLKSLHLFNNLDKSICLFVWIEVLLPSQPIWVMLSMVSLLNHTFPGQA